MVVCVKFSDIVNRQSVECMGNVEYQIIFFFKFQLQPSQGKFDGSMGRKESIKYRIITKKTYHSRSSYIHESRSAAKSSKEFTKLCYVLLIYSKSRPIEKSLTYLVIS